MKATLTLFALISSFAVFATTNPATTAATASQTTAQPAASSAPAPTVVNPKKPVKQTIEVTQVCKYNGDINSKSRNKTCSVHPGDYIIVKFSNANLDSVKRNLKSYRLWINGVCFPNMEPLFINESAPGIIFHVERDTAHNSPWQLFYTSPNYWHFYHSVSVNLGTINTKFNRTVNRDKIDLYTSIG